jgi:GGDEF domain-containing protein
MNEPTVDLTIETSLGDRVTELELELLSARSQIGRLELQLHVLASTDALTGLANRNGVLDSVQTAVARRRRMGEPFAVVGFRFPQLVGLLEASLPDEYEEAIQHLAALLAAGLRNVDRIGRLDEETFVVVLTNIESSKIPIVVDRTIASVRALPLSVGAAEVVLDPAVAAAVPGEETPEAEAYVERLVDVLVSSMAFSVDTLG